MDMENEFEIDLDIRFQKGLRRLKMKKNEFSQYCKYAQSTHYF